jgi:hypothetical protein
MALKPIKVNEETLKQLTELMELPDQDQCQDQIKDEISENISTSIYKVWLKHCKKDTAFIYIDDSSFKISPKEEHQQFLHKLTGNKGPYTVVKTFRSWVGLSDGVYKLENCDKFVPIAWFEQEAPPSKKQNNLLIVMLVILSILQSLAMVLII